MSTLTLHERSPFDILFRNFFDAEQQFAPALNSKQPHPLNIFYNDEGLHFEVACTGLTKEDVLISVEGDLLKISYKKPETDTDYSGYIYHGLSKKSFDLGYKDLLPVAINTIVLSNNGSLLSPSSPKFPKSSDNSTVGVIPSGSLKLSLFLISISTNIHKLAMFFRNHWILYSMSLGRIIL